MHEKTQRVNSVEMWLASALFLLQVTSVDRVLLGTAYSPQNTRRWMGAIPGTRLLLGSGSFRVPGIVHTEFSLENLTFSIVAKIRIISSQPSELW